MSPHRIWPEDVELAGSLSMALMLVEQAALRPVIGAERVVRFDPRRVRDLAHPALNHGGGTATA
jgi:hypothetical protein